MKRLVALVFVVICFAACQKAPELSLSSPATVELSADGSSDTITFTANRDWTASCSDSWIHVSPSSGSATDGLITVSVRCDANTTYDDRGGHGNHQSGGTNADYYCETTCKPWNNRP